MLAVHGFGVKKVEVRASGLAVIWVTPSPAPSLHDTRLPQLQAANIA